MRTKTILASGVSLLFGAALSLAADPNMGTWKLNEGKSKFAPGSPKNHTVVYSMAGDDMKVTVDGVDKDGKGTHNEWVGKFDGKDYPVTGDAASDTRAYTKLGDGSLDFTGKKAGKVMVTGHVAVSADGKTRTVTTTSTDSAGKQVMNTGVYDKQ